MGEQAAISNADDVAKLKVEELRAWLLLHDPALWVENKKVKGKPALVELVQGLWARENGED